MANGWGGAREGAGRPKAGEEDPASADLKKEQGLHEKVKREQREFNFAVARGEYLPRVAQQQAAATALAVLTQSLRAIPDVLERVCNLTPEQADLAQKQVDTALAEVAAAFKAMAGEA